MAQASAVAAPRRRALVPLLKPFRPDNSFCTASLAQNQLAQLLRLPSQGARAAGYSIGRAQSMLWQPAAGHAASQSSNSSFSFTHIQICGTRGYAKVL